MEYALPGDTGVEGTGVPVLAGLGLYLTVPLAACGHQTAVEGGAVFVHHAWGLTGGVRLELAAAITVIVHSTRQAIYTVFDRPPAEAVLGPTSIECAGIVVPAVEILRALYRAIDGLIDLGVDTDRRRHRLIAGLQGAGPLRQALVVTQALLLSAAREQLIELVAADPVLGITGVDRARQVVAAGLLNERRAHERVA